MRLYTIYDRLAEESGPLFEAKNDLIAWRMFLGVQMPGNREDYKLLSLGIYHHDPVHIELFTTPIEVSDGKGGVEDGNEAL